MELFAVVIQSINKGAENVKQNELNTLAQKINQQLMTGTVDMAKLVIDSNTSLNHSVLNLDSRLGAKLDAIHGALSNLKPPEVPTKPAPPPLCKTCRYCLPTSFFPFVKNYEFAKCLRPQPGDARLLVDGARSESYCSNERRDRNYSVTCGSQATYYEPKVKP